MIRELLVIELIAPLLTALAVLAIRGRVLAGVLSTLASLTSFTASVIIFVSLRVMGLSQVITLIDNWVAIPGIKPVGISFLLDPLSSLVSLLITGLSTLILLYSISYVNDYGDTRRYWFLMLMFVTSMLTLVLSDNLLLTIIGWEGVGLCSYFLIGYYYGDERRYWVGGPEGKAPLHPPTYCATKAILVTGFSDALMLVGALTLAALAGSFYYEDLAGVKLLEGVKGFEWVLMPALLTLITGPIAKSAQFPLHIWLPDAMAGPTPVSALLHSATMVKAGVYLIARLFPVFMVIRDSYPEVMTAVSYILMVVGGASIVDGAVHASTSLELKRILAHSTVSQIGYMFLALGVALLSTSAYKAYAASIFHLVSHAIFKASLFLVAGVLIHVTNTIYISEMRLPPRDFKWVFLAMTFSGLSLAGLPPLLGFWSKDYVIEVIHDEGLYLALVPPMISAFLTSYYVCRVLATVFRNHSKYYKSHEVSNFQYS